MLVCRTRFLCRLAASCGAVALPACLALTGSVQPPSRFMYFDVSVNLPLPLRGALACGGPRTAFSSSSRRNSSAAGATLADPEEFADGAGTNPFDFGFPTDRDDQGFENQEGGGVARRRHHLGQFAELIPVMQGHKIWKEAEESAARVRRDAFIAPTTARTAKELRLRQTQKRKTKAAATRSSVAQHKDYAQEVLNRIIHTFTKQVRRCVRSFPKLQDLHPFDLAVTELNLDNGLAEYVQTLATARRLCNFAHNLHTKHVRLCREELTDKGVLDRLKLSLEEIRKEMRPRMAHVDNLRELRHKLRSQHVIDPERPTAVLVGAPNVGKSSLVRAVSTGTPEVQNYSFTTRSLSVGHIHPPSTSQLIFHGLRRREQSVARATAGLEFPVASRNEGNAKTVRGVEHGAYLADNDDGNNGADEAQDFLDAYERLARGEPSDVSEKRRKDPMNPLRTPEEAEAARERERMFDPIKLPDSSELIERAKSAGNMGLGSLVDILEEDRRQKELRRKRREEVRVAAGGRTKAQKERWGHKAGAPNAHVLDGKPSGWGRAGGGSSGLMQPHEIIQVTDTPGLLYRPLQAAAAEAFDGQIHPEESPMSSRAVEAVAAPQDPAQGNGGFAERYLAEWEQREALRKQADGGEDEEGVDVDFFDPEMGPAILEGFGLRSGMYDPPPTPGSKGEPAKDGDSMLAWARDERVDTEADAGIFNDPYEWLASQHQAIEREEEAQVQPPPPVLETLRTKMEARRRQLLQTAGVNGSEVPVFPELPQLRFNRIEQLTLTSLQHLRRPLVLFVLDASGESGYSLAYQLLVRRHLRHLFPELPWLDVLSKTDLLPPPGHPDHAAMASETSPGRHFWSSNPEQAHEEQQAVSAALTNFWNTEPPESTVNMRLMDGGFESFADWSRSWPPAMHAMLDGERDTLLREMGLDNLPHDLQQLLPPGVFWVSSQDNRGIDRLKALIVENLSAF